jgi:hypothetical protein
MPCKAMALNTSHARFLQHLESAGRRLLAGPYAHWQHPPQDLARIPKSKPSLDWYEYPAV